MSSDDPAAATDSAPATAVDRLAALLDGVDLELLRSDFFPTWRVWYSEVTGVYHARRRGNFCDRRDGRQYALAASTPARLALLLLNQDALDDEQRDGET